MLRQVIDLASLVPTLGFDSGSTLASVTETDASQNLELALTSSAALSAGETVAVAVSATPAGADRDAAAGADYTAVTSASLSAGTTHTVVIPIAGDVIVEPDETFVVTLAAVGAAYTIDAAASSSTVTIEDNDTAALTFGPAPTPETDAEFTLSASLGASVQVPATTVGPRSALTFRDSGTSTDLVFTDTDGNGIIELGERNASVTLTHATAETVNFDFDFAPAAQHGLVAADFTAGTIDVTVTQAPPAMFQFMEQAMSVKEADEDTTLTFRLMSDKALGSAQTVGLRFGVTGEAGDVDASSGDYVSMESVTFPANETTATFDVTIKGDLIVEGDEKFTVTLVDTGDAYALGSASVAVATIGDDDDSAATITLSLVAEDRSALTAPPSTGPVRVRALLHKKGDKSALLTPARDITFLPFLSPPEKWGGAEASTLQNVTMRAGESEVFSKAIPLAHPAAVPDAPITIVIEPDNSNDIGDFKTSEPLPISYVALGDPTPPVFRLRAKGGTVLNEKGPPLTFTIEADKPVDAGRPVKISLEPPRDLSYPQSFATLSGDRADVMGVPATLDLSAGQQEASFTIAAVDDDIAEHTEQFRVVISPSEDATFTTGDFGAGDEMDITINSDDKAALTLDFPYTSHLAFGLGLDVTLTLDAAVELYPKEMVGSVFRTTSMPYRVNSVSLSEEESERTGFIEITDQNGDGYLEGAELIRKGPYQGQGEELNTDDRVKPGTRYLEVVLLNASRSGYGDDVGKTARKEYTIYEEALREVSLAAGSVSVVEGEDAVIIVNVSPVLFADSSVSVAYGSTARNDDNDAMEGADYTAVTTLPLRAGETSAELRIPVARDDAPEPAETFVVELVDTDRTLPINDANVIVNNAIEGDDNASAVVTIVDATLPQVQFVAEDVTKTFTETDANTNLVLNLESSIPFGSPQPVNVAVTATSSASDRDAAAPGDYTDVTSVMLGASGTSHSIMIPIVGDEIVEPDETFVVTISAPGAAYTVGLRDTSTVTIKDDDTATIEFPSTNPADVTASGTEYTVNARLTAPVQYAAGKSLTFYAGETEKTVALRFTDGNGDGFIRGDEMNVVAGLNGVAETYTSPATVGYFRRPASRSGLNPGSGLRPRQFSGAAHPDDSHTLSFAEARVEVEEGGTATLTLNLEPALNRDLTVGVVASPAALPVRGSTEYGYAQDYAAPPAVRIPAGQTSADVSVPTIADTIFEYDEDVMLEIQEGDLPSRVTCAADKCAATVTIKNDDPRPVIGFSSATQKILEGRFAKMISTTVIGANIPVRLQVSADDSDPRSLRPEEFSASWSGAREFPAAFSVIIPPVAPAPFEGGAFANFKLDQDKVWLTSRPVEFDSLVHPDRTYVLTVLPDDLYSLGEPSATKVIIEDEDTAPLAITVSGKLTVNENFTITARLGDNFILNTEEGVVVPEGGSITFRDSANDTDVPDIVFEDTDNDGIIPLGSTVTFRHFHSEAGTLNLSYELVSDTAHGFRAAQFPGGTATVTIQ